MLCFKYRPIARLFFLMEMMNLTFLHSLPYEQICGNEINVLLFYVTFFNAICLMCDARLNLVILIVAACTQTVLRDVVLDLDTGLANLSYFSIYTLIGIVIMVMASILNHVASLHMRLRIQINEYFNLINRMREGVLVFVKEAKICGDFSGDSIAGPEKRTAGP